MWDYEPRDFDTIDILKAERIRDHDTGIMLEPLGVVSSSRLINLYFGEKGDDGLFTDPLGRTYLLESTPREFKGVWEYIISRTGLGTEQYADRVLHENPDIYFTVLHPEFGDIGHVGMNGIDLEQRVFSRTIYLKPGFYGMGFGSVARDLSTRQAYSLGFDRIEASAAVTNIPSLGLKKGYVFDGISYSEQFRHFVLHFHLDLDRLDLGAEKRAERQLSLLRISVKQIAGGQYTLAAAALNSLYGGSLPPLEPAQKILAEHTAGWARAHLGPDYRRFLH